jgi:hypothetical protein
VSETDFESGSGPSICGKFVNHGDLWTELRPFRADLARLRQLHAGSGKSSP